MTELPVVLLPIGSYRLLLPASCLSRLLEGPVIEAINGVDCVLDRDMHWPLLTPRFAGAGQRAESEFTNSQPTQAIRVVMIEHEACRFALRVMGMPESRYLHQGQLRPRRDLVPGAYAIGAYEWGQETVLLPNLSNIAQALKK